MMKSVMLVGEKKGGEAYHVREHHSSSLAERRFLSEQTLDLRMSSHF